jgi:hypothetical protein
MNVTSKWWIFIWMAVIGGQFFFHSAEGAAVAVQTTKVETMLGANPTLSGAVGVWNWLTDSLFWNFSVLNANDVGRSIRIILFGFTIAILIQVFAWIAIAIGKPLGGS